MIDEHYANSRFIYIQFRNPILSLAELKSFPPEWADWIFPEIFRSLNKLVTLLKLNLSEGEQVEERRENEFVMQNSGR